MHTKEQAQKLWCPMQRPPEHADLTDPAWTRCVASQCAMWRWISAETPPLLYRQIIFAGHTQDEAEAATRPPNVPASWPIEMWDDYNYSYVEPKVDFDARQREHNAAWPELRTGFCGLGGRPE